MVDRMNIIINYYVPGWSAMKEIKIPIRSITIKDNNTKYSKIVDTCRTVEDIVEYIEKSEEVVLPDKTSSAYWQLIHGKENNE